MKRSTTAALLAGALLSAAPLSQAAIVSYQAALRPEVNGATGSGFVTVDYDDVAQTLLINANWTGLSGTTTVAHIHCCTALPGVSTIGVAVTPSTLPAFPVGTQSGTYVTIPVLDLTQSTTFTTTFVNNFAGGILANAPTALIAGFESGRAYFNIHTVNFPAGEIRGFLQRVPEPATAALVALGLAGLALSRRRAG